MRLSKKIAVDAATNRFVTQASIRATECLVWCSRDHVFSMRVASHPFKGVVDEALQGYKELPNFSLVELATQAWFAGRTNHPYAPSLYAVGLESRQHCHRLSGKNQQFIEVLSNALFDDLKPVIDIVCKTFVDANPEEAPNSEPALFALQLQNTFEWVVERSIDFKNSPKIPKGMQSLGEALVPFIDFVPHASKYANTVVCVTSNECNPEAIKEWANDVEISDPTLYHKPVLLLATASIGAGRQLFRNCSDRLIGVTNGEPNKKLPFTKKDSTS